MKNKLFWPILILSIVIMVESILLMSDGKNTVINNYSNKVSETEKEEIPKNVIDFSWSNEESDKVVLTMKANKKIAIDAIDLYIAYEGITVSSIKNLKQLPEATFSKISTEKSLVVMNYLIIESEGFKIEEGQSIKVAQFNIKKDPNKNAKLSIDSKTQVVENGTAKVLPFYSKGLIINRDTF